MKRFFNSILKISGFLFLLQCLIIIFFLIVFWMRPDAIVKPLASWLIVKEDLKPSEVIVVIGGSEINHRFSHTTKLFNEGYGEKIIVSGAGEISNVIQLFEKLGVSKDDLIIENDSLNTFDNAVNTKKLMQENHFKSMVLVTAPDQSKRARFIFDKVFRGSGIAVSSSISDTSFYYPETVMDNKTMKHMVALEWIKYVYYAVKYLFYH